MKQFQLELREANRYAFLGIFKTIYDEPNRFEVEHTLTRDLCRLAPSPWHQLTRMAYFMTCKLNHKISDSVHARMILGEKNTWTKRYIDLVGKETFGQWII